QVLEEPDATQHSREPHTVVELNVDCMTGIEQAARFGVVALDERLPPETIQRRCLGLCVTRLMGNGDARLEERTAHFVVANFVGKASGAVDRAREYRGIRNLADQRQDRTQSVASSVGVTVREPERPQRGEQPQADVGMSVLKSPFLDRQEIPAVSVQSIERGL